MEKARKPLTLTDANFKKEVFESKIPVLVDFWASWCPPCKMMEPVIDDLACIFRDRMKVLRVNVDLLPKIRSEYNIVGVPTFILFKGGRVVAREVGARSEEQLVSVIKAAGIFL